MPRYCRSTHWLPYTVISSCLIYFHLRQKASTRPRADEWHHSIAIHCAISLPVEAAVAAAPVGTKQGTPALLTLFHRAVLIISKFVLWAHILAAAFETEDATFAIVAWQERGPGYAEKRL